MAKVKTINFKLRIPQSIYDKLAQEAEDNKRSINSEILIRIDRNGVIQAELDTLSEETKEFLKRNVNKLTSR